MDVRGVGSVSGAVPIRPANTVAPNTREAAVSRPQFPSDELQLSSAGKMLDQLSQTGDLRQERLARIKEAIENGTYDTDEKLEAALGKMFDSLGLNHDDE
jgi:anti-sigma28 factor (negative regulator of flagellin synthesis)